MSKTYDVLVRDAKVALANKAAVSKVLFGEIGDEISKSDALKLFAETDGRVVLTDSHWRYQQMMNNGIAIEVTESGGFKRVALNAAQETSRAKNKAYRMEYNRTKVARKDAEIEALKAQLAELEAQLKAV